MNCILPKLTIPDRKSTKKFKVSIALCTYFGEVFIREQLHSILNQTHLPDEIIICDDGSKDKTVKIIEDIIKNTSVCIRVFVNDENIGFIKNFEKAINLCRGDIIFLSDQDDVWFPEKIKTMLEIFIRNCNLNLVYSDAIVVDEKLNCKGVTVFATRKNAKLEQGQSRSIRNVIMNPDLKGCLMAFRSDLKKIILPIPKDAQSVGWGHDHWIAQISYAVGGVYAINWPLMYYRRSSQNSGGDIYLNGKQNRIEIINIVLSAIKMITTKQKTIENNALLKIKRYQLMSNRLIEIRNVRLFHECDLKLLSKYITEYQQNIFAFQKRTALRNIVRPRRFLIAAKLLFSGYYSKFFRGFSSFMRDIFLT